MAACGAAGLGPAHRRDPRHLGGAPRPRLPRPAARAAHPPRRARPGSGWDAGHARPAGHRSGRKRRRPGWWRSCGWPGRQRARRPWRPAGRGCRAEPGRAGHHHRAVVRADRPVRHPSRGRRVRPGRRGRRPGPGRRSRPRPAHPVVRYRAAPRRHRRRPRLRTRPPPPAPAPRRCTRAPARPGTAITRHRDHSRAHPTSPPSPNPDCPCERHCTRAGARQSTIAGKAGSQAARQPGRRAARGRVRAGAVEQRDGTPRTRTGSSR